jgi:hypothetical protein
VSPHEDGRLLEALRFEGPDRLIAVAGATEDYAMEFANGESRREILVRGSAYALSASLWCLVEPKRASRCFDAAAREYGVLGSPLAVPLSVCAVPGRPRRRLEEREVSEPRQPPEVRLLEWMWRGRSLDRMVDNLAPLFAVPTGRFGLPLGLYLDFARSFERDIDSQEKEEVPAGARPYLQRIAELTRRAMGDAYHWSRFQTGLLPVEPEPLAMCLMLARDLSTELQFDPGTVEYVPLQVAMRLVELENEALG